MNHFAFVFTFFSAGIVCGILIFCAFAWKILLWVYKNSFFGILEQKRPRSKRELKAEQDAALLKKALEMSSTKPSKKRPKRLLRKLPPGEHKIIIKFST